MSAGFEIRPLHAFTQAEIWPVISGYETLEIYGVEKSESEALTSFDIRLTALETPYQTDYYEDFSAEECKAYGKMLAQGYSFGAYQGERLIGLAIGEAYPETGLLRVWEFHVAEGWRRMGVGRGMMERVIAAARGDGLKMIMLETQNTNVPAVRFYRRMGFSLEAIDLWEYFHMEGEQAQQTAFFMKQRL